jgi:hypothetical protein
MRAMPARLIACLLVFVVLCFGFGSLERPSVVEPPAHGTPLASLAVDAAEPHPDGQAAPLAAEPLHEGSALLPAALTAPAPALAMVRPGSLRHVAIRAPHLEGLLRPPCRAA